MKSVNTSRAAGSSSRARDNIETGNFLEIPILHLARRISCTAVFWSYITTALRFGGVVVVLPIVLRTIPQDQLGLYYVFQSLGIFSGLLDIGIAPTIARSVSFLWAGAQTLGRSGEAQISESGEPNWELLRSLYYTFSRFYWLASGALLLILSIACLPYIWHITAALPRPQEGRAIWILLAIGSAWNFSGSIWTSLLGGINRVREQQLVQLLAIGVGYAITVLGLFMGFELWAMAAAILMQATVQRQIARALFLRAVGSNLSGKNTRFDWELFRALWPSSSKTGVIVMTVTVYLSAPVFLTSTFLGLNVASQVGLSFQIGLALCQIASVAILVKVPLFSILRVSGRMNELRRIFAERAIIYVVVFSIGSLSVFCSGRWLLHCIVHSRTTLPDPFVLALILIFLGIEGLQSLFRGLALSMNVTVFWRVFAIRGSFVCLLSTLAIPFGLKLFFATLLVLKFCLIDIQVIRVGLGTLGDSFLSFFNFLVEVTMRVLQFQKSSNPPA